MVFDIMLTDFIKHYTVEEYPMHDAWNCRGNCSKHPLMTGEYLAWCSEIRLGAKWGDLVLEAEAADRAAETERDRIERLKREAAAEDARRIAEEVNRREVYARDVAIKVRMGLKRTEQVAKRMQPCKWGRGRVRGRRVLGARVHGPQDRQARRQAHLRPPAPWRGGLAQRVGRQPALEARCGGQAGDARL